MISGLSCFHFYFYIFLPKEALLFSDYYSASFVFISVYIMYHVGKWKQRTDQTFSLKSRAKNPNPLLIMEAVMGFSHKTNVIKLLFYC